MERKRMIWRKGVSAMAVILAAALVAGTLGGCQSQPAGGTSKSQSQPAGGASESQSQVAEEVSESQSQPAEGTSKGQPAGKEWTMEAKEPEAAALKVDDYEGWNALLGENQISEDFRKALEQFAFESGSMVLKQEEGNGNYSPLSLYYALALAGCGAEGETASRILNCLGVESQEELADQCRKLYKRYVYQAQRERETMAEYGEDDYKSTIQLGNSLWASRDLRMEETYQKLAAEQFFASTYGVDFADPETGRRMGSWIAEKTRGVLEPQLETDPETMLAILNTLYFYGAWMTPFPEEQTKPDDFTREDGSKMEVLYLNRTDMMGSFYKGDGYTVSSLPTNNRCRMVFLLPEDGRTAAEFLQEPENLRNALAVDEEKWSRGEVIWKVPKFSFGSSYQLKDALCAMGMEQMFGGQADFGGISQDPLWVSSVIQETHIGLEEQGVEGAAYTMMAIAAGAMIPQGNRAEMILDRPFLFGIQDQWNGAWLFLGVCREPEGERLSRSFP